MNGRCDTQFAQKAKYFLSILVKYVLLEKIITISEKLVPGKAVCQSQYKINLFNVAILIYQNLSMNIHLQKLV